MTTIQTNKRGYILMEIVISIIILSILGIALLKINADQKKLYTIATSKLEFSRYVTLLTNRHSISLHDTTINLYDLIKNEYNLRNDLLIKDLKNINIKYTQKYGSIISFEEETKKENILIDEIKVSDQQGTSKFLTVKQ